MGDGPQSTVRSRRARWRVGMVIPLLLVLLVGCRDSGSTSGEPSDTEPGTLVALEQTGGIAGVRDQLTVAADGTFHAVRGNPPVDETGHLSAGELESLRSQLESIDFGRLPTRVDADESADHFLYAVTYDGRTVRIRDDAIPSQLKPLLSQLMNLMSRFG